jgi:hypothetical protein
LHISCVLVLILVHFKLFDHIHLLISLFNSLLSTLCIKLVVCIIVTQLFIFSIWATASLLSIN